ncbi:MAG: hypothetical protein K940chlam9_01807 [Chlamydiae bacterium]|nr:hypothetical protein [Chlamydiota bacterium]
MNEIKTSLDANFHAPDEERGEYVNSYLLSKNAHKAFSQLLMELKSDPDTPNWPNYGKLGRMTYHCHLKKGRPTYEELLPL